MAKVPKQLARFGSRFAFEFFLETMHDSIIKGLKRYLSGISAEDIPGMVRSERFPSLAHLDLSEVGDNVAHIEKISLLRLVEFIAEARPDLVAAIQEQGESGVGYMVKLRQHILDRIKQIEFKPEQDMVLASCDKCGKQWLVPKDKAADIRECPFCGTGGDEGVEERKEGE